MSIWLGHTSTLLENCEDAWNEDTYANVTASLDTSDFTVGSGSAKFTLTGTVIAAEQIGTEALSSTDVSACTHLCLWVKASTALAAGALLFEIDETAKCASASESLALPALVAGQWTGVVLVMAGATSTRNAIISVGLRAGAELASGLVINVDEVRALTARQFTNCISVRGLNRPDDVIHSKATVSELIDGDMFETVPVKSRRTITLAFNALSSEIDQYWLEAFVRKSDKRIIGTNDIVPVVYANPGGHSQEWLGGTSIGRRPVLVFTEKTGWTTQPVSWTYA